MCCITANLVVYVILAVVTVLRTGCPTFLRHFQPAFSSLCLALLFQPWYLCVSAPLILCLSNIIEEFTPFSVHFAHSVQEQYLHDLTQARSPFVDRSSSPHQTI